jgi:hypothetical protein
VVSLDVVSLDEINFDFLISDVVYSGLMTLPMMDGDRVNSTMPVFLLLSLVSSSKA